MSELVKDGDTVTIHYKGYLNEGDEFDSSRTRGEPFTFVVGSQMVIPGFSNGVLGMQVGESKTVNIPVDQAYGERNEEAVQAIPKSAFQSEFEFKVGLIINGNQGDGRPFQALIKEVSDSTVTLDFNHRLAGKDLIFDVELLGIGEQ